MREKYWSPVGPYALTANGTADGTITIPSTYNLSVKQKIILKSNTNERVDLQIKRVLSLTQIKVGPAGKNIDTFEDVSDFLIVDNARFWTEEQPRVKLDPDDIIHAAWAHEPITAWRVSAVDQMGDYYGPDNPFPVNVSMSQAAIPYVSNISTPLINTEYIVTIPMATKRFQLKVRDGKAKIQLATQIGQTDTTYITIPYGNTYSEESLDLNGELTFYIQLNKADQIVELLRWE